MLLKVAVTSFICIFIVQSVSGLFWDFSRPTNNAGQAAAGGAFLGAAGLLTLCWVKDNCRGKRETDPSNNVSGNILNQFVIPSLFIRKSYALKYIAIFILITGDLEYG